MVAPHLLQVAFFPVLHCYPSTGFWGFNTLLFPPPPNLSCFNLSLLHPVLPAWVWRTNCSARVKCFSHVPSPSSDGSYLYPAFPVSEVYTRLSPAGLCLDIQHPELNTDVSSKPCIALQAVLLLSHAWMVAAFFGAIVD